jgi:hypothetical protein
LSDHREDLAASRHSLLKAVLLYTGRARRFERAINLVGAVGGSILLGIGSGMSGDLLPDAGGVSWKGVVIASGAALALVGNLVLLALREEGAALVAEAARAQERAQGILDERDQLERAVKSTEAVAHEFDRRRVDRLQAFTLMLKAIELALHNGHHCNQAAQLMLEAARDEILRAVDYRASDYLSIAIFRRMVIDGDEVMHRVGWVPTNAHKAGDRYGRNWSKGYGYTGVAWELVERGERGGVVEPDTTPEHVRRRYPVPSADPVREQLYKSVAAIPILVGGTDDVWGIVTVTTDRKAVFSHAPGLPFQSVGMVSDIAAVAALLAQCGPEPSQTALPGSQMSC